MEVVMNIVTWFGGVFGLVIGFAIIGAVMIFALVPFVMMNRTSKRDRVNTPESRGAQNQVASRS